ncbi:hypothetical protein BGX23_006750 [Mortierella sp. AD031]|nr:hypothetical protein BGX23_006750 [Mortierella sp. AD031]
MEAAEAQAEWEYELSMEAAEAQAEWEHEQAMEAAEAAAEQAMWEAETEEKALASTAPSAVGLREAELVREGLQNLGLLQDVETMIRLMQRGTIHPLPELRRLSLGFATLQPPQDEIERLFPKAADE